jgi:hypothetical protein
LDCSCWRESLLKRYHCQRMRLVYRKPRSLAWVTTPIPTAVAAAPATTCASRRALLDPPEPDLNRSRAGSYPSSFQQCLTTSWEMANGWADRARVPHIPLRRKAAAPITGDLRHGISQGIESVLAAVNVRDCVCAVSFSNMLSVIGLFRQEDAAFRAVATGFNAALATCARRNNRAGQHCPYRSYAQSKQPE